MHAIDYNGNVGLGSPMQIRTPKDVGALIKERRQLLHLDQRQLAERVGVSRLWINQVERGKPGASLGLVLRTLVALGIELLPEDLADNSTDAVTGPDINAIVESARSRKR